MQKLYFLYSEIKPGDDEDEYLIDEETREDDAYISLEGDCLQTMFDIPIRFHAGTLLGHVTTVDLTTGPVATTTSLRIPPHYYSIEPVNYHTRMEYGWSQEQSPGFHVCVDNTIAIRDSRVGRTEAVKGKVGFVRGIHAWTISWDAEDWGFHPVIGIGTQRTPTTSDRYEPLVGGIYSFGWHLRKQCLLHNYRQRMIPYNRYPGLEFRDPNEKFKMPTTLTVILDMEGRTLSFMAGDRFLGIAFRNLPNRRFFPMASATWGQTSIKIKYKGGFYEKPDSLMKQAAKVISPYVLKQLKQNYALPENFDAS